MMCDELCDITFESTLVYLEIGFILHFYFLNHSSRSMHLARVGETPDRISCPPPSKNPNKLNFNRLNMFRIMSRTLYINPGKWGINYMMAQMYIGLIVKYNFK